MTEPPITKRISEECLDKLIKSGDEVEFPNYPNHTQSVERCIKVVTESSSSVCGSAQRDGWIRARLASRSKRPKLESKIDLL